MEVENIISYPSVFDNNTNITLIFKENKNYEIVENIFKLYGFGFYSPEHKTIIIDGELFVDGGLDFDDLRFIEAHEMSHLILGHENPGNYEEEMDADLGAYILLKKNNLPVDTLIDSFKERHGVEFSENLLVRVEKFF